jgi:hypothetical protein
MFFPKLVTPKPLIERLGLFIGGLRFYRSQEVVDGVKHTLFVFVGQVGNIVKAFKHGFIFQHIHILAFAEQITHRIIAPDNLRKSYNNGADKWPTIKEGFDYKNVSPSYFDLLKKRIK